MILDEIKKMSKSLIIAYGGTSTERCWDLTQTVVKLSDIEKILGEKCKWKHFKEYRRTSCVGKDGEYTILNQFGIDVWKFCPYCGKEIQEQFEVKDEN